MPVSPTFRFLVAGQGARSPLPFGMASGRGPSLMTKTASCGPASKGQIAPSGPLSPSTPPLSRLWTHDPRPSTSTPATQIAKRALATLSAGALWLAPSTTLAETIEKHEGVDHTGLTFAADKMWWWEQNGWLIDLLGFAVTGLFGVAALGTVVYFGLRLFRRASQTRQPHASRDKDIPGPVPIEISPEPTMLDNTQTVTPPEPEASGPEEGDDTPTDPMISPFVRGRRLNIDFSQPATPESFQNGFFWLDQLTREYTAIQNDDWRKAGANLLERTDLIAYLLEYAYGDARTAREHAAYLKEKLAAIKEAAAGVTTPKRRSLLECPININHRGAIPIRQNMSFTDYLERLKKHYERFALGETVTVILNGKPKEFVYTRIQPKMRLTSAEKIDPQKTDQPPANLFDLNLTNRIKEAKRERGTPENVPYKSPPPLTTKTEFSGDSLISEGTFYAFIDPATQTLLTGDHLLRQDGTIVGITSVKVGKGSKHIKKTEPFYPVPNGTMVKIQVGTKKLDYLARDGWFIPAGHYTQLSRSGVYPIFNGENPEQEDGSVIDGTVYYIKPFYQPERDNNHAVFYLLAIERQQVLRRRRNREQRPQQWRPAQDPADEITGWIEVARRKPVEPEPGEKQKPKPATLATARPGPEATQTPAPHPQRTEAPTPHTPIRPRPEPETPRLYQNVPAIGDGAKVIKRLTSAFNPFIEDGTVLHFGGGIGSHEVRYTPEATRFAQRIFNVFRGSLQGWDRQSIFVAAYRELLRLLNANYLDPFLARMDEELRPWAAMAYLQVAFQSTFKVRTEIRVNKENDIVFVLYPGNEELENRKKDTPIYYFNINEDLRHYEPFYVPKLYQGTESNLCDLKDPAALPYFSIDSPHEVYKKQNAAKNKRAKPLSRDDAVTKWQQLKERYNRLKDDYTEFYLSTGGLLAAPEDGQTLERIRDVINELHEVRRGLEHVKTALADPEIDRTIQSIALMIIDLESYYFDNFTP